MAWMFHNDPIFILNLAVQCACSLKQDKKVYFLKRQRLAMDALFCSFEMSCADRVFACSFAGWQVSLRAHFMALLMGIL